MSVVTGLKKAAEEIRAEGHNGWGNACEQAAAHIEEQQDTIAELKEQLRQSLTNASFYRCCALSGETPKEGSEPYPAIVEGMG